MIASFWIIRRYIFVPGSLIHRPFNRAAMESGRRIPRNARHERSADLSLLSVSTPRKIEARMIIALEMEYGRADRLRSRRIVSRADQNRL